MFGLGALAKKVFGTANDRKIKATQPMVAATNALEPELEKLSDEALRARTAEFRARVERGEPVDDLMAEAFATVREASKRTLGMRHFDVQLAGGMVLHQGKIAEMKTGEGKTLVATLPVYLNALEGRGVHVVTVNDYLARRDAEWMGEIYKFLGLSVGVIVHGIDDEGRREQYACDVTYGTNNEFGFDYLRDNMKYSLEAMVQRGHRYAIVDEVDSILVDEARTPLIISGPAEDSSALYIAADEIIPTLQADHYEIDEKVRAVTFTEDGQERVEEILRERDMLKGEALWDTANVSLVHHLNQALRAHRLFTRDKDYIVKNGEVVIIDEFTGRMMPGRRYSEGLHQALEAKERVDIKPESQTLASITFQNYFRLYDKLAGMTGTAATEAEEFMDIYKLDVVEAPPNLPIARDDEDDVVYRTAKEKYDAILEEIADARERGQPVLVGTASIEKSEFLAELLKSRKIPHQVLNARYHEQEAMIIAQAGAPGAITIATNMAGRGTDIQLGGNPEMRVAAETAGVEDEAARARRETEIRAEIAAAKDQVIAAGGLYVLGTERHESRRIDNQLRGRSGRQGDPGRSTFFLSLEDDLMRIFGSERMDAMLQKLGLQEGEAIVHSWINKAIEKAQGKVEARNFDIRKNLLKYDDVMNDQRKAIFEQRIDFMRADDVNDIVTDMRHQLIDDLVAKHIPENAYAEQWDAEGLKEEARTYFGLDLPVPDWAAEEGIADEEIRERLYEAADGRMAEKAERFGPDLMRHVEKTVLLSTIDHHWREHLVQLDHLRQVVGLRGFAQRDPLNEFKSEGFDMFESLLARLREDVTGQLSHVELAQQEPQPLEQLEIDPAGLEASHMDPLSISEPGDVATAAPVAPVAPAADPVAAMAARAAALGPDPNDPSTWGKVPRNAPCPCGSGKKYKHCHGRLA